MKKYFISLIVFFIIISLNSCEDKDDGTIRFYTALEYYTTPLTKPMPNKTNGFTAYSRNFNTQKPSVEIRGGDGNYTFRSSDQEVIHNSSIYVDFYESDKRKFIFFTPLKEGNTIITVTDGKGLSAQLKVTVNTSKSQIKILESRLIMNDEIKPSIQKEIEADISKNFLRPFNEVSLIYNGEAEGTFVVHEGVNIVDDGSSPIDSPEALRFEGTFTKEENGEGYLKRLKTLNLTCNGQTQSYSTDTDRVSQLDWKYLMLLITDLTDYYKAKYPNENITEICYALSVF